MSTSKVITAGRRGPITLDLRLVAGRILVGVGDCGGAQVELSTPDSRGPAADAVRSPRVSDEGDLLVIDARVEGGSGVQVGRNVYGGVNIGSVAFGGGVTIVNGVVVGGGSVSSSSGIEARVVLPLGSSLIATTMDADVIVHGPVRGARVKTMSGDIEVEHVAALNAETMSGNIRIGELAGDGRAKSMSGDIGVERGGPWRLRASTMSGDISTPRELRLDGGSMSGRVRTR